MSFFYARVLTPVLTIIGCHGTEPSPGQPSPPWITEIESPLPSWLSETGIFEGTPERVPAPSLLPFTPRFPLYSNGLDKDRLVYLPPGETIEVGPWEFPLGTVLAKTFSHEGAPVETRLLFRRAERWDYALYVWDAAGQDAELRTGNWPEETLSVAGVAHTLPARLDCRACHETSERAQGTPVLGLSPHQVTDAMASLGVFSVAPTVQALGGRSPAEDDALGYFVGNCVSCHTGQKGDNASFSLYPSDAVEQTVNQATTSETSEGVRVVPGDAARSALFLAVVGSRTPGVSQPFKAMPPIGWNQLDPTAEGILERWIGGL